MRTHILQKSDIEMNIEHIPRLCTFYKIDVEMNIEHIPCLCTFYNIYHVYIFYKKKIQTFSYDIQVFKT